MLYELISNWMGEQVHATENWRERALGTLLCPACCYVDRSRYPEPLSVDLVKEPSGPFSAIVFRTGIKILHFSVIDALQAYLDAFTVGSCRVKNASKGSEFRTLYSRDYIVLRSGDRHVSMLACERCGSTRLMAGAKHRYAVSREVRDNSICQVASGPILVNEEVRISVKWEQWADIELLPVEIRNE